MDRRTKRSVETRLLERLCAAAHAVIDVIENPELHGVPGLAGMPTFQNADGRDKPGHRIKVCRRSGAGSYFHSILVIS